VTQQSGIQEEDQKGLPDDMSCAGIFGSGSTKTVVIEHHRMNESGASPFYHTSNPVMKPTEIVRYVNGKRSRGLRGSEE
jgi:hypothetical protein